jgi:hypothetical protein
MKGTDYAILALVALLALGLGAVLFSTNTVEKVPYAVPTVQLVSVPTADNTTLEIRNEIFKDKDFEVIAEDLALAELKDDDYEALFDFLVANGVSIVDEEDLDSVVVKDTDVSNVDSEDKDAVVNYELKVYYEDADGDDKKVYVNAEFTVEDNEVEEVSFALA